MNCPDCGEEMDIKDTTYSNINTDRCCKGEKTGDIYYCYDCDTWWLDNYLTGGLEAWSY
jgi:hypothetical protein